MAKWNLVIDVARCHDCNNCFIACMDEFVENDWPHYSKAMPASGHRWMNILRRETGMYPKVEVAYLPLTCQHCDDAACIKKAEDDSIYKREDGIVIIDPEKARGRKDIVDSCPYGAVFWNEDVLVPQKCTLCAHLLDQGWETPRCVQVCPTGALTFMDAEVQSDFTVRDGNTEVYKPEFNTSPRIYYQNLHLFTRAFIAGNAAVQETDECAVGADVALLDAAGEKMAETTTNEYGDFKFHNLEKNSGPYKLVVEKPGYESLEMIVKVEAGLNVGTIFL